MEELNVEISGRVGRFRFEIQYFVTLKQIFQEAPNNVRADLSTKGRQLLRDINRLSEFVGINQQLCINYLIEVHNAFQRLQQ